MLLCCSSASTVQRNTTTTGIAAERRAFVAWRWARDRRPRLRRSPRPSRWPPNLRLRHPGRRCPSKKRAPARRRLAFVPASIGRKIVAVRDRGVLPPVRAISSAAASREDQQRKPAINQLAAMTAQARIVASLACIWLRINSTAMSEYFTEETMKVAAKKKAEIRLTFNSSFSNFSVNKDLKWAVEPLSKGTPVRTIALSRRLIVHMISTFFRLELFNFELHCIFLMSGNHQDSVKLFLKVQSEYKVRDVQKEQISAKFKSTRPRRPAAPEYRSTVDTYRRRRHRRYVSSPPPPPQRLSKETRRISPPLESDVFVGGSVVAAADERSRSFTASNSQLSS
uniref:Uncharacterized protein n=1 Tax=Romanomermis culicivorax TaxID=13658 RepID=A0A915I937_ROMCU